MPATGPERPFSRYAAPGQLKPLDDRTGVGLRPVLERPAITFEPWRDIQGILNKAFTHDTQTRRAVSKHWTLLREYYEALLQRAKVGDEEEIPVDKDKMRQFNATYRNPALKSYRPRLMERLSRPMAMIESRFASFNSGE